MSYKSALQSTKSMPCTNIPIHCPFCPRTLSGEPRTIWKYNAISHLICDHPEPVTDTTNTYKLPLIPGKLLVDMFISRQEEMWMGISERATFEYRDDFELPGSDDIEEIRAEYVKRERAETVSVVEPKGKRRKA